MKKLLVIILFLTLPLFGGTTEPHSLNVAGLVRTYQLHVPAGAKGPMALVIALHGGGGNGSQMERSTRFSDLADREKFVVAYPDGLDHQWNDGERGSAATSTDDIGFMRAMIADIKKNVNVDPSKIFVAGMSNGAAMSSRIGCEMSDTIRAIAPVSNTMKVDVFEKCNPKKPVGVMGFHGTEDPIVPYEGGEIMLLGRGRGHVISTKQFSEFWAKQNGCDSKPVAKALPDIAQDSTSVTELDFQHCKGAPVVFYSIKGGGHAWPNGLERRFRIVKSVETHQVDATELIWQFFKTQK